MTILTFSVPAQSEPSRLDKILAQLCPEYSRACLQQWIRAGRVQVNYQVVTSPRALVVAAAELAVTPALLPKETAFEPDPIPLTVVYEDESLLVINKPAGLVTHPGVGHWRETILNALIARYGEAAQALPRAGIVHRLDKDTSGLLVVARTPLAYQALVTQLTQRTMKRRYLTLVWGAPPPAGTIERAIMRDPRQPLRFVSVEHEGGRARVARTHYHCLGQSKIGAVTVSALCCALDTGRTHQIRVHLADSGYPIIGDPTYGRAIRGRYLKTLDDSSATVAATVVQQLADFNRQALHAFALALQHPVQQVEMQWNAPLPSDLVELGVALGLDSMLQAAYERDNSI